MAHCEPSAFVCCTCSEVSETFVTRAEVGSLYQVCGRCFHLGELATLLKLLPAGNDVRKTAEEGLETLYLTVKNQVEEIEQRLTPAASAASQLNGAEESEGSSEESRRRRKRKRRRRRW